MSGTNRSRGRDQASEVDDLVSAVLTASRVLVGVSAASLAEIEGTVTLTQFRALVVLDARGAMNLSRLAETLGVNSSTAMRTVDRLLAAGLVTRRDNPRNRREVVIDLTSAGHHLTRKVTERRRAEIHRIVRTMPAADRVELVRALIAFADAAGEPRVGSAAATLGW